MVAISVLHLYIFNKRTQRHTSVVSEEEDSVAEAAVAYLLTLREIVRETAESDEREGGWC